jgi:uncharacterized protein YbaR (Trm112 family)
MTQSDIPSEPEQPPRPPPVLVCPGCGVPMDYRGERRQVAGSKYRDDIFICPSCKTELLRPRKA